MLPDGVGPSQLITLLGAFFPAGTKVFFNGIEAPLLYVSPTQINAVVPPTLPRGCCEARMELDVDGVRSNTHVFLLRAPNPTVKVYLTPDGGFVDRGALLADVRLSNGSSNSPENPARINDVVTIYATGLDLSLPISVWLDAREQELIEAAS